MGITMSSSKVKDRPLFPNHFMWYDRDTVVYFLEADGGKRQRDRRADSRYRRRCEARAVVRSDTEGSFTMGG